MPGWIVFLAILRREGTQAIVVCWKIWRVCLSSKPPTLQGISSLAAACGRFHLELEGSVKTGFALVLHSFSTECGLPSGARADTLIQLQSLHGARMYEPPGVVTD